MTTAPPLYPHQERELLEHPDDPGRAYLWQMRSGKSRAICELSARLERDRGLAAVVVVAPNGVHSNWAERELPEWVGVRPTVCFSTQEYNAGRGAGWDVLLREPTPRRALWLCVPTHACDWPHVRRLMVLAARRGPTLLVVDESDDFGSPSAGRTRWLHAFAKKCRWRRILSGTVVENSPLRAYAQYELLAPAALGYRTFGEFKARYAVTVRERVGNRPAREKVVGYQHLDELRERMARYSSVVLRADVGGLPPLERAAVRYDLPPEAAAAYRSLSERCRAELPDGDVALEYAEQKFSALHRMTSGLAHLESGELAEVPGAEAARLAALDRALGLTGGRSIVWCAFREDVVRVAAHLRRLGWSVVTYYGSSSEAERRLARDGFRPGASGADALVGHPAAAGRGLNLSAAAGVVWYSHTFDAVHRAQADERATLVGKSAVPVVDVVANGTVDEYILSNLSRKRSVSEDLARGGLKAFLERTRASGR
jgi:hypothetical protein